MLLLVVCVSIAFLAWNLIDMIFFHFHQANLRTAVIYLFGLFFLVLVGIDPLETLQLFTKERVVHVEVISLVALIIAARKIILIDYATTSTDILWYRRCCYFNWCDIFFIKKSINRIKD